MLKKYKTVFNSAQIETIEKKSRFIATVRPVKTEEEAKEFIEEMRKQYWDATHNVFAYQIGENNQIQRFSDDGEPSGTAGMPVLDVLKGEDLKNVAVVVTRYFGGTLLGTGGLVRAYGRSAKQGLQEAEIIQYTLYKQMSITAEYTLVGKIQYEILQSKHIIKDTLYTDKVEFIILVEVDQIDKLMATISEITGGNGLVKNLGEVYGTFVEGELHLLD